MFFKKSILLNCFIYKAILLFSVSFTLVYGQDYSNNYTPRRIILNLTENPSTSIAVTWRTNSFIDTALVEYALSTGGTEFKDMKTAVTAESDPFSINDSVIVYSHSAVLSNLDPATNYVYRVGSSLGWSEWNQIKTASDNSDPFEFVYFGDPQVGLKSYCSRVFRKAFQEVPDASFWLFAGDIVNTPNDSLWSEFFYAGDFIFRSIPSLFAAGNHDHILGTRDDGKKFRKDEIGPIWNANFTLPDNGIEGLEELSYYTDYQGVRFVVLESHTRVEEQAVWLDKILSDNPNKWTIVSFHHPLYSTGRDRNSSARQDALLSVFDKHNVDLVLQGHDHVYGRTYKLCNNEIVDDNDKGTVYVVSMSGGKFYEVKDINRSIMAKMGGDLQLFQKISIDGNKLHFKAITANGELFDEFELAK